LFDNFSRRGVIVLDDVPSIQIFVFIFYGTVVQKICIKEWVNLLLIQLTKFAIESTNFTCVCEL
jgi:hypothetical protein